MESEQLDEEWLPILQQLIDTVLATPLDGKSLLLNQKHRRNVWWRWNFCCRLKFCLHRR